MEAEFRLLIPEGIYSREQEEEFIRMIKSDREEAQKKKSISSGQIR
jgi:hypothetical protein